MPASEVKADHDVLKSVADILIQQADQVQVLIDSVKGHFDVLVGGGWIGVGEKAWQQEQEDDVHPALERLQAALETSGQLTGQISQIFQDAEDEAGSALKAGF